MDKTVFAWFPDMRVQNVPISDTILQQKAKDYVCILCHDEFKATNGWLQGSKDRHGVVGKVISGKCASADNDAATSWVDGKLTGTFSAKIHIYNVDERALFYHILPSRTVMLKGDCCHGGKQSKLCLNTEGESKYCS